LQAQSALQLHPAGRWPTAKNGAEGGKGKKRLAERAKSLQLQRPACHPHRRPHRRRRRRRHSGINVSRADAARGGAKGRDAARRGTAQQPRVT